MAKVKWGTGWIEEAELKEMKMEEKPLAVRVSEAVRWLRDMGSIGNHHAELIGTMLNRTLLENDRVTTTLMTNLAPLLRSTIGRNVAKADILKALAPIQDLLGAPVAAAGPITPPVVNGKV